MAQPAENPKKGKSGRAICSFSDDNACGVVCDHASSMGGEGNERTPQSPQKTADSDRGGAESNALPTLSPKTDPALAALIDAWADLPEPVRRGILAMVEAAKGEGA